MTQCPVNTIRRSLRAEWQAAEQGTRALRETLARAARMATEIAVGCALPGHLEQLDGIAEALKTPAPDAAALLLRSLADERGEWQRHVAEKRCGAGECFVKPTPPCRAACPANIDIPNFMALVGGRRWREALEVILKDSSLPCSCGLVCPAPCQDACVRRVTGDPVFIRPMKAVAAENAAEHVLAESHAYPRPATAPPTGKRVAIIGSGPAGITAAYYLALRGHRAEIFEAQEQGGGMLRYGIPAYRLPREVLDRELDYLTSLGVAMHTSAPVSDAAGLRQQGFDACFLAIGLQLSRRIPVQGIDLPFVFGGVDFLRAVSAGEDPRVGPKVVVVGGGNVAVDVALTALRQGAAGVTMVCLEARHEMPASPGEIRTALEEGVEIRNSWGPVVITPDQTITFQRCTRVFDDERRFNPQFDAEARMSIAKADHVILAVGQAADLPGIAGSGIKTERGVVVVDRVTLATSEPGIFAGGDVTYGPRTVVAAIRSGKQGAASIDAFLAGKAPDPAWADPPPRADVPPLATTVAERNFPHLPEMPERTVAERVLGYARIELGLTDQMAYAEAARCLRCDLCIGCGLCELVCSELGTEALRMVETPSGRRAFVDFDRPASRCIGCGACAQACPTGAIRVADRDGVRATVITGTEVQQVPLLRCRDCGGIRAPRRQAETVERLLAGASSNGLCPACARTAAARQYAAFSA